MNFSFRMILGLGALFVLSAVPQVRGNALTITNFSVINASGGTAELTFDMSWSNSWRSSWTDDGGATFVTNWDAVWVFAKQRVSGGDWNPVYFTDTGHVVPSGYSLWVGQNGGVTNPGVMIHLNSEGAGGVTLNDIVLRWDYVASGLFGTNQVDYSLFAVEMVYIPEGSYYLGSGGSEVGAFFNHPNMSQPFQVTNNNTIVLGAITGALNAVANVGGGILAGVLSNEYPKGYAPFYSMKYEITQGQYADFLNHISPGRAIQRFPNNFGSARHTIRFTNGIYEATAPDRACNYMNWDDMIIYLDWAGLRPLTELEYEKMCRGFKAPVPGELAFGDIIPTYAPNAFLGVDGSGTETFANPLVNVIGGNLIGGPVRVGIFATTNSTRLNSGAGYFGNMELSGNVWEGVISIGDVQGRAFQGESGDGNPVTQPASWPTITTGSGFGLRGGSYIDSAGLFPTSYRQYSLSSFMYNRLASMAGRGGRTAP